MQESNENSEFYIQKRTLDEYKKKYNETSDNNIKYKLRRDIYEMEKIVSNLCNEHLKYKIDEYGEFEYVNADKKHNCKICGCPLNFKS